MCAKGKSQLAKGAIWIPKIHWRQNLIWVGHIYLHWQIKLALLILADAGHGTFRCFFLLANRPLVLTSSLLCIANKWGDVMFRQFSYLQQDPWTYRSLMFLQMFFFWGELLFLTIPFELRLCPYKQKPKYWTCKKFWLWGQLWRYGGETGWDRCPLELFENSKPTVHQIQTTE